MRGNHLAYVEEVLLICDLLFDCCYLLNISRLFCAVTGKLQSSLKAHYLANVIHIVSEGIRAFCSSRESKQIQQKHG